LSQSITVRKGPNSETKGKERKRTVVNSTNLEKRKKDKCPIILITGVCGEGGKGRE